ncbi:putative peroxidase [Rosa chinensis]|uniref:peroxidase n=1 Tax=Rosa chinensis TaxID=74649 RepID=A0A2P6QST2_ROSCH|nr:putative peroxidase [Rosa chinensis]
MSPISGCDSSILINSGKNPEKSALAHAGVKGFDVIESAKSRLEVVCQGLISYSDIIALAARDAISLVSRIIAIQLYYSIDK